MRRGMLAQGRKDTADTVEAGKESAVAKEVAEQIDIRRIAGARQFTSGTLQHLGVRRRFENLPRTNLLRTGCEGCNQEEQDLHHDRRTSSACTISVVSSIAVESSADTPGWAFARRASSTTNRSTSSDAVRQPGGVGP